MLKPYPNLKSKHLSTLLNIVRVCTVFGMLSFLASIVLTVLNLTGTYYGALFLVPLFALSIGVMLVSGIFALLVAYEESYRIRVAKMVNVNET